MVAGLALGAAGLIIWKANAHPAIRTRPLDARAPLSPAPGARMRLAPAAGRQWAGLRLTGDF
jgi:hypothetical protein